MIRKLAPLGVAAVLALSACSAPDSNGGGITASKPSASTATKIVHAPAGATINEKGVVVYGAKAKADAPKVAIYTDPQCPICSQFEEVFGEELLTLAQKGEISLRYVTLTFLDKNLKNDSSVRASQAMACSVGQDKYGEYAHALYSHQPTEGKGFTDEQLRVEYPKLASFTDAQTKAFRSCYDSKSTAELAAAINTKGTEELYAAAKQVGTPSITVNGKFMELKKLPQSTDGLLSALKDAAK